MRCKLVNCFVAGALSATIAFASPALARGGGFGGGMHGGGMGGGMHGAMGGGMHFGGMGGGMHFGGMGGGMHFAGTRFAGGHFVHPGFSRFGFRGHRFFHHHRFDRFAFVGGPFLYAGYYDDCWRRLWTPYGPHWVNVCGYY